MARSAATGENVVGRLPAKVSDSDEWIVVGAHVDAAGITEEYVNGDTTPHVHAPGDEPPTVNAASHSLAARLVTYVVARELGAE